MATPLQQYPIKLSDIKTIFGGNAIIKLGDYYTNNVSGFTTGIFGLPATGTIIKFSNFLGKTKGVIVNTIYTTIRITSTVINPTLTQVTGSTTNYYYKFLHYGPSNTYTVSNYTEYTLTFSYAVYASILVVGGGGGGGCSVGSGGGGGGIVYMVTPSLYTFPKGTYKIRVGAGGMPMLSTNNDSSINGTTSIIFDSLNNALISALGGGRGNGQSNNYPNNIASRSGGSGAGGCRWSNNGGSGTQTTSTLISTISKTYGFGFSGGPGNNNNPFESGGGGGAGANGIRLNGGNAKLINITGNNEYYAAGGGGCSNNGGLGYGGQGSTGVYLGGIGSYTNGGDAIDNTGSGGGGGLSGGGTGSAGIIIIAFNKNQLSSTTPERQYPPKNFNAASIETTSTSDLSTILPTTFYKEILTIDPYTNGYGIGTYNIYSSSSWASNATKKFLFNYITDDADAHFGVSGTYNAPNGTYGGSNYIINGYKGDWIIIKLPYKIILTKFIFYQYQYANTSPKTWKCYVSNNGINFTELTEVNELTGAIYTNKYTEKILPSYFDIPYLYIGWTFGSINLLLGTATNLQIGEIQLFGKDDISTSFSNVWIKNGINIYNNTIGNIGIGTTNPNQYKLNVIGDINASSFSSNGYNLDLIYNKNVSNLLYTITSNITENTYPPTIFNSYTDYNRISGDIPNIRPSNPYKEILTYDFGDYIIYSSDRFNNASTSNLFTAINTDVVEYGYNYDINGYYISSKGSYIQNNYYGDWIIIKLSTSIILTKFSFTQLQGATNIGCPSLWRCYGSIDGIIFSVIPEASNEFIPLISDNYVSGIYTKIITNTLNISYRYIGFVINKLIGSLSIFNRLIFTDLKLYGREITSITPIYTTSNQIMTNPNILKKFGFTCSITTAVTINSSNFFKYDINLTNYISTQNLNGSSEPYRIFKITVFKNSGYFGTINNDIPDILSYEIYMSNKLVSGSLSNETSGINICAIGYPINYKLDKIMPTSIFLMNSTNFNYISIIASSNINVRCIITDLLN